MVKINSIFEHGCGISVWILGDNRIQTEYSSIKLPLCVPHERKEDLNRVLDWATSSAFTYLIKKMCETGGWEGEEKDSRNPRLFLRKPGAFWLITAYDNYAVCMQSNNETEFYKILSLITSTVYFYLCLLSSRIIASHLFSWMTIRQIKILASPENLRGKNMR
jgi:hypothetical protein